MGWFEEYLDDPEVSYQNDIQDQFMCRALSAALFYFLVPLNCLSEAKYKQKAKVMKANGI